MQQIDSGVFMFTLIKYSWIFRKRLLMAVLFIVIFSSVAAAQRFAVSSSKANIRSGPGTGYDILWEVEKYHPVEVLKKKGAWRYFRDFEGDEGWIHEKLLQKDISAVITKKDKCNVRGGPGTKNAIMFSAEKGIPFKVLGQKGNWIKVLHADGDKGWIHSSLIW
jgi:SH3-like domain-containing protein